MIIRWYVYVRAFHAQTDLGQTRRDADVLGLASRHPKKSTRAGAGLLAGPGATLMWPMPSSSSDQEMASTSFAWRARLCRSCVVCCGGMCSATSTTRARRRWTRFRCSEGANYSVSEAPSVAEHRTGSASVISKGYHGDHKDSL